MHTMIWGVNPGVSGLSRIGLIILIVILLRIFAAAALYRRNWPFWPAPRWLAARDITWDGPTKGI